MGNPKALYDAVKSGRVRLDQINEEGKAALKWYMQAKNSPTGMANDTPLSMIPGQQIPLEPPKPEPPKRLGLLDTIKSQFSDIGRQFKDPTLTPQQEADLDRFRIKPESTIGRFSSGLVKGATFVDDKNPNKGIAYTAGEIAGAFLPFGASYKGARLLTGLGKAGVKATAGRIAATGAIAGAPVGAASAAIEGEDTAGIAKRALLYGGLGALGDVAAEKLLLPALKTGAEIVTNKIGAKTLGIPEQLYSPMKEEINKGMTAKLMPKALIQKETSLPKPPLAKTETKSATALPQKRLPKPSNTVVMEGPKNKFSFKAAWDKFLTRTVDTQRPIVQFSEKAGDKTGILASNTRNVNGTVNYILKDALVDRNGNKIGKSLKEVAEQIPKGKEKDFWEYMAQRHNIDRAREGKNVIANYTPEMSMEAVSRIEAKNPGWKKIGDEITNWIDAMMLEWGVNAGTVDDAVYSQLRQTYKSYFPTQREFSQLEQSIPEGVRKQFVDTGTPIRKATGSERDINNPIENIMNLVNRTVKTARYNEVGQSLLESVRKQPEKLKQFAEIIPASEGMFSNVDNIVTVMEKGKPVYLRINNKELLDALNGLPKIIGDIPLISTLTRGFKGLVTQKNPLFAIRNIARDIPTAYVYGSETNPLKFAGGLAKAGKDILTNSENLQRYRAVGGGMSNFFSPSRAEQAAKELLKPPSLLRRAGNAIEIFNNMTETAPRLAEFNRVLERTGDVQKALAAANDVTVNFARGGDLTKKAERIVPYLNAGVQGLDRFFRSFKSPKTAAATLIKGGIAISTPEIALYLINKDDPNYQALDNRTKDTYYLIPKGDGKFIKIPKSRELGVLFGALFQRIMRAAEGEKEPFKGFGGATGTVATNFFVQNPLTDNILSPLYYNIPANKDFAGRSIVPLGMQLDKRSPYLQYDEKTSEIAKSIGEQANKIIDGGLSPKQIDYLIRSWTGVIGQLGLPATTAGQSPAEATTRQFIADPLYNNEILNNFYEKLDELQRKATDRNLIEKISSKAVTQEEKQKNAMLKASKQISKLQKQKMAAQSVGDIATVTKLQQQILDLAQKALKN